MLAPIEAARPASAPLVASHLVLERFATTPPVTCLKPVKVVMSSASLENGVVHFTKSPSYQSPARQTAVSAVACPTRSVSAGGVLGMSTSLIRSSALSPLDSRSPAFFPSKQIVCFR